MNNSPFISIWIVIFLFIGNSIFANADTDNSFRSNSKLREYSSIQNARELSTSHPNTFSSFLTNKIIHKKGNGALSENLFNTQIIKAEKIQLELELVKEDLEQVYNGTPKEVGYITTPNDPVAPVYLIYGGSLNAPTNAGEYSVVAILDEDPNYYYAASETKTLTIAQAPASISLVSSSLTQTFGSVSSVQATTNPLGIAYVVKYDHDNNNATPMVETMPTQAGKYKLEATITDPNYVSTSAQGELVINKAKATIAFNTATLTQTFGQTQAVTAITNPGNVNYKILYDHDNNAATPKVANMPQNAGTYEVEAIIEDDNYEGDKKIGNLKINPAAASISLDNNTLNQKFGQVTAVTATTTPAGISYQVVYDHDQDNNTPMVTALPANVGTYEVKATVTNPNYQAASSTGQLVIEKAAAQVTLSGLNYTYDGTAKSVTTTTNPASLSVNVTYNGNSSLPVNAGAYEVVATVNDKNYQGSASGTLEIAKANATITLSGLSHVYDGQAKPAAYSTSPQNLTAGVTYNGSTEAPVQAGSYNVEANIVDTNYKGSASGTLTIAKAAATITLSGLNQVYNGNPKPISYTTSPTGLSANVTYNGSSAAPVNAGIYDINATISHPNYQGNTTGQLVIGKATPSFTFTNLTQTYDGQAKTVNVSTTPAVATIKVTYDGNSSAPVDAGNYAVKAEIVDPNYEGVQTRTLTVEKASASISLSSLSQVYDGTIKTVSFSTNPANLNLIINYSPNNPKDVGSYKVTATIEEENYAGSATNTLTITPAPVNITLSNLKQTYDGSAKVAGVSTDPPGVSTSVTYNGSSQLPVNAGIYQVQVSVSNPNYSGSKTGSLEIEKKTANITLSKLVQTFDNKPKPISYVTDPENLNVVVTYDGNTAAPSKAGEYTVEATINEPNYKGNKSGTLTIQKSTNATVNLTNLVQTYNGQPREVSYTTNPAGLKVEITYDGSSAKPVNAGNYNVVVVIDDKNYSGAKEETFVINKATASLTLSNLEQVYNGNPKSISYTTQPAGLNVEVLYDGSTTTPIDAGEYSVIANINDQNYKGSVEEEFLIEKATADISMFNLNQTYSGNPITVEYITTPPDLNVNIAYNNDKNFIPVNAGEYNVNATIVNDNYQGSESKVLKVNKANAAILISDLKHDYDGTAKKVAYTTSPANLNVRITYDNSTIEPTEAGSYQVVAAIDETNYSGSTSGIMEIDTVPATITLNNMTQNYTGEPITVDYQTNPAGINVAITYDGSATAPVEIGSYEVQATIEDNNYFGSAEGTLEIIEVSIDLNDPPYFTSSPTNQVTEDEQYIYNIETSDPDQGDLRTISSVNPLPSWLNLTDNGDGTGLLSGTPTDADIGNYDIQLKVTDESDSSKFQSFTITVIDVNYDPEFISDPPTNAIADIVYTYNITVADQDSNDEISINAISKPDWLNFKDNQDGTALLSGTPLPGNKGNYEIELIAEDGNGGKATQNFIIRVNQIPVVSDFEKQVIEDNPLSFTLEDFTGNYSDTDGDPLASIKITRLPANGSLVLNNSSINAEQEISANELNYLLYQPTQDYTGEDNFSWNASDGYAYADNTADVNITISGSNDAPVLANLETQPIFYTSVKDVNAQISETITVTDPDGDDIVSAQISISPNSFYPDQDVLNFENTPTIKGSYDDQAGILLLQGKDSQENYQNALRSVSYQNVGSRPTFQSRIINIYVNDGNELSNILKREIQIGNIDIRIPTGITPNGDNINDTWIIDNIESFPDCVIKVYTRTGNVIFTSQGYQEPWDGTYETRELPAGTYYYTINLNQADRSGQGKLQGTVTIIK